ncbi:MAG TPA: ABC transporter ATP-binding protein [Phenylobacterium sp.]|jgi:ABC-2 type transport system ATP-binding protein|uniref:ABC transporter ATP-binding protein n=1 Tax=Phenylobacterium sp. TaxID=1871053 RepID=UPI002D2F6485|nr:ABC transporter ATP-binding protein [Phenylobacterium sp.]HZZ68527.1 ABC transporter ATP-binding protein [Phenylobacterium sp.]
MNGMDTALARLSGVRKRFGEVQALDGLDLEVRPGELLAVLGPNGAGKTTAIALMLGLQQPDAGQALLFGRSPRDLRARRGIGVMMQEVALPDALKVRELVAMTRAYYPAPPPLADTIARAGIEKIAERPYAKLSGGQKRQAQFALAICGGPRLLFLDEPTTGLDVTSRETMWATLRALVAGGAAIVLTTHYIEEAQALADRVLVMAKGRRVAEGTVGEMRALVSRKRVECVTALPAEAIAAWPEVAAATPGDNRQVSIVTTDAEAVVRKLLAADPKLSELEVRRAGLSEAFAELTAEPSLETAA